MDSLPIEESQDERDCVTIYGLERGDSSELDGEEKGMLLANRRGGLTMLLGYCLQGLHRSYHYSKDRRSGVPGLLSQRKNGRFRGNGK